jgi:uncharacterized protein (TIGR01777 family)
MRFGMGFQTFVRQVRISAPAADVFRWHTRPGALERLTPPWEGVKVLEQAGGIIDGSRVVLGIPMGPLQVRWVAEHRGVKAGREFRDVQLSGPFAHWEHIHRVVPDGPQACYLEDHITYALPFNALSNVLAGPFVRQKLERLFTYRHTLTRHDIAAHAAHCQKPPLHVLVTGSTGLIGSALAPFLTTGGHRVTRLVRATPSPGADAVPWDALTGRFEPAASVALDGIDAVVHLAGDNIASGRWTDDKKAAIRHSRVQGTRLLCERLAALDNPPAVLVCASATGYYGDRGDQILHETSAPGTDFLSHVCRDWEAATAPAIQRGIRVVHLRLGMVLSPAGGALAKMLWPFRLGAGGVIGDGHQYTSWIALDDVVGAIHHSLYTNHLHGPVNAVSPQPVTNRVLTRTLGRVLRRPTAVPLPAAAVRLAFGDMADALLLSSTLVEPTRLLESGYAFRLPTLEGALRHLLGKT